MVAVMRTGLAFITSGSKERNFSHDGYSRGSRGQGSSEIEEVTGNQSRVKVVDWFRERDRGCRLNGKRTINEFIAFWPIPAADGRRPAAHPVLAPGWPRVAFPRCPILHQGSSTLTEGQKPGNSRLCRLSVLPPSSSVARYAFTRVYVLRS